MRLHNYEMEKFVMFLVLEQLVLVDDTYSITATVIKVFTSLYSKR